MNLKNRSPNRGYAKISETVDMIPLDGSPKSFKPFYVGKYMNKSDKLEDEIMNSGSIPEARRKLYLVISYVPGPYDKVELVQDHDQKYNDFIEALKKERQNGNPNKQVMLDETKDKLASYLDACAYTLGRIREKFDEAFGWYEKRCMMVIGPFGGGARGVRRTYIGDNEIPKDGEYINEKTGEKITFRLNSLIKRNINQAFKEQPTDPMEEETSNGSVVQHSGPSA